MTLQELADKVNGKIAIDKPDTEIKSAYASDLLSDVMGHCADESALVTIQNHLNTIAVCTLVGIEAIVVCHDRPIPDDMAEAAKREGVAIVATPMSQFEACVALAALPAAKK